MPCITEESMKVGRISLLYITNSEQITLQCSFTAAENKHRCLLANRENNAISAIPSIGSAPSLASVGGTSISSSSCKRKMNHCISDGIITYMHLIISLSLVIVEAMLIFIFIYKIDKSIAR